MYPEPEQRVQQDKEKYHNRCRTATNTDVSKSKFLIQKDYE